MLGQVEVAWLGWRADGGRKGIVLNRIGTLLQSDSDDAMTDIPAFHHDWTQNLLLPFRSSLRRLLAGLDADSLIALQNTQRQTRLSFLQIYSSLITRSSATSKLETKRYSGVDPSLSLAVISAPSSMGNLKSATPVSPHSDPLCNGIHPCFSWAVVSVPGSMSMLAASTLPNRAPQCSGVIPSFPCALASTPCSTSLPVTPAIPDFDAS